MWRRSVKRLTIFAVLGLSLQTLTAWCFQHIYFMGNSLSRGVFAARSGVLSVVRTDGRGVVTYYGGLQVPPPDVSPEGLSGWQEKRVHSLRSMGCPIFEALPEWGPFARPDSSEWAVEQGTVQTGQGWPCPSLYYTLHCAGAGQDFVIHGGVPLPRAVRIPLGLDDLSALPLVPIWPGLALNTGAFGAGAWAFAELFKFTRRQFRHRPGSCPRCSYDLRDDLSAGCPECGWNRDAPQQAAT
jgi:hypothetical protein